MVLRRSQRWLLVAVFAFLLIAAFGPIIWIHGPEQISLTARLKPPSILHPFVNCWAFGDGRYLATRSNFP